MRFEVSLIVPIFYKWVDFFFFLIYLMSPFEDLHLERYRCFFHDPVFGNCCRWIFVFFDDT